jgi:hypothetical protein
MVCGCATGTARRKVGGRDREGQDARREAVERRHGECEVVWAREDVLALGSCWAQVLGQMLRLDEKRGAEAAKAAGEKVHPAASSSSPAGGARHATMPPPASPPPILNDDIEDDKAPGAIPSSLSPA